MSTTNIPKTFTLVENPTSPNAQPKTLATGTADIIRLAYTEHAATAEGPLRIYEIDPLTDQIITDEAPF